MIDECEQECSIAVTSIYRENFSFIKCALPIINDKIAIIGRNFDNTVMGILNSLP